MSQTSQTIVERHVHPKFPRLQVQLRADSRFYQAWTALDGRKCMKSTKVTELATAFKLAEDWYRKLLRASVEQEREHPMDRLGKDPTIGELLLGYKRSLEKARRAYAAMRWQPIEHFWKAIVVTDVSPKTFKEFYQWRRKHSEAGNHTVHKDITLIRQVLKFAIEEEHITAMPFIPKAGKIEANPRPWLTMDEWNTLLKASQKRIDSTPNKHIRAQRQDTHDLAVFIVSTLCRVDEALAIRFADCRTDRNSRGEEFLIAHVQGKRGHRTTVAPIEAVEIVRRRFTGDTNALVFPEHHVRAFRQLLIACKLYKDDLGYTRNYKSLRVTGISFRVMRPNSNLLMIARNAGTSVAMLDQFYTKRLSAQMHSEELSTSVMQAAEDLSGISGADITEQLRQRPAKRIQSGAA